MAITDSQKIDLLYKKIGFGVSKTDTSTYKSPSNEANASPLLTRGDTIWQQSSDIPVTIPVSNSSVVVLYNDTLSSTVECVPDTTSHPSASSVYPTWFTNLRDWVPPEFGATYQVKVYAALPGNTSPQSYTQLFADGSGNNDSWYFDYQAGILQFPDTNIPTVLSSAKHVYISGARYVGQKGISSYTGGATFGNITISGNTISDPVNAISFTANVFTGNLTNNNTISTSTLVVNNVDVYSNISGIANNVSVLFANAAAQATTISTTDANVGAYQLYANANAAAQQIQIDALSTSTYSNANVSAFLPVYTGNISAGNVLSTLRGNVYADYVYPRNNNVVSFNYSTAIRLPTGPDSERPSSPVAGQLRFNTESSSIEFYTGLAWMGVSNDSISGQSFYGDGVSDTYTLDNVSSENGILVSINGTVQQPGIAYTVAGDQITFAEIPQVTDYVDVRFLGLATVPMLDTIVVDSSSISLAANANTTIDTFSTGEYRSAKYTVSGISESSAHMAELMTIQQSNTVLINAFGILNTSANTVTYYATTDGTTVTVFANATVATSVRLQKTYFII